MAFSLVAVANEHYVSKLYIGPAGCNLRMAIWENKNLTFPYADNNVKYDGPLWGVVGTYEYRKFHNLYAGVYGCYFQGTVTKGSYPDRKFQDGEGEIRFGYNYMALQGASFVATPYLGFGFNYIAQKREIVPVNHFKYFLYYIPIGFLFDWHWNKWFTIGFYFKWMPQVDATLRLTEYAGARFILIKKLEQFLAELPLVFTFGSHRRWDITLTPFWLRKKTGDTKNQVGCIDLGIPKTTYTYAGADLTVGYSF